MGSMLQTVLFSAVLLQLLQYGQSFDLLQEHDARRAGTSCNCHNCPEYKTLSSLMKHETCFGVDKVFSLLQSLYTKAGVYCRISVIHTLAGHFGHNAHSPSQCDCQGRNVLQHYSTDSNDGIHDDYYSTCINAGHGYKNVFNSFFTHRGDQHVPACRTHHSLWSQLDGVQHNAHNNLRYCQKDIIQHLEYAFRKTDPCTCTEKTVTTTTTKRTTTRSSTVTTMPTTTRLPPTTKLPTTNTPILTTPINPLNLYSCNKLAVIQSIALETPIHNSNAYVCQSGIAGNNEDLVLAKCNVSIPDNWHRGDKVITHCGSIPLYTPIATFDGPVYNPNGAQSGVFIGCIPNGFRIAVEHCFQAPTIEHIELGGLYTKNPQSYFVIV